MLSNFRSDLEAAREAEFLVLQLLAGATNSYSFDWVGDDREYFHKGDIRAINRATGKEIFIEVKDDSRIAETDNILCEDAVDYDDYTARGNIHNDYDIYIVVSKQERKIYVLDGDVLRANYKLGEFKYIQHRQQATLAYLLPLGVMRRRGGLLAIISYDLESRRASIAA